MQVLEFDCVEDFYYQNFYTIKSKNLLTIYIFKLKINNKMMIGKLQDIKNKKIMNGKIFIFIE